MRPQKVLFLCIHNGARSQMAEAFLKQLGENLFEASSAGLEPGSLNPLAVAVMQEAGLNISGNATKSVFDLHSADRHFDYVITVCDPEAAARCPVFPGAHQKRQWSFRDPASFTGTQEEKMALTREVRDQIRSAVREFIRQETNP